MKGRISTEIKGNDAAHITPKLHTQNCGLRASKLQAFREFW